MPRPPDVEHFPATARTLNADMCSAWVLAACRRLAACRIPARPFNPSPSKCRRTTAVALLTVATLGHGCCAAYTLDECVHDLLDTAARLLRIGEAPKAN